MERKKTCREGMKSRVTYFWGVCWLMAMVSCDSGYETLPSGLEYKFITQHDSTQARDGEYVMLDVLVKTGKDSVLFSTQKYSTLFPFRHDTYKMTVGLDNPLEEGFHLMSLGDSAHFRIPAEELYKSTFGVTLPDSLDPQQSVMVVAKAVSIYDYEAYSKWRQEQTQVRNAQLREIQEVRLEEEIARIKRLLEQEGRDYQLTDSGIGYYLIEPGSETSPTEGDTVHFTYEVRYTDGTRLEGDLGSSGPEGKSFVMGKSNVLPCWQESIALLSEGGRGQFYFPSACAFGEPGGVRPNAILVVDLQLLSIK